MARDYKFDEKHFARLAKAQNEAAVIFELSKLLRAGLINQAVARWAEWDWIAPHSVGRGWGDDFRNRQNQDRIDLVRRILTIRTDEKGIYLAVMTLLGEGLHDPTRNAITQARYEQQIDECKFQDYVIGIEIMAGLQACAACLKLVGQYELHSAPKFPSKECSCEFGSTSYWQLMLDDQI